MHHGLGLRGIDAIFLPDRKRRGIAKPFVDRQIVAGRGHKGRLISVTAAMALTITP